MAWPNMADVAAGIKSALTGEAGEPSTEAETTDAPADVAADTSNEGAPAPTADPASDAPNTEAPATPTAPTVVEVIKEKGVKAFIDELPEDVRKAIGTEVNKNWHTALNQRDAKIKALEEARASSEVQTREYIDKRIDELVTASMSDEEKADYLDKRELARRREADKAKTETPSDPLSDPAIRPFIAQGWKVVKDAGLPIDPSDERVAQVWHSAWNEPDPESGLAKMREAAQAFAPKPEPAKPAAPAVDVDKRIAEMVDRGIEERLRKMGMLKADTGKPSGGSGKQSTDWDVVRKEAEAAFRSAR